MGIELLEAISWRRSATVELSEMVRTSEPLGDRSLIRMVVGADCVEGRKEGRDGERIARAGARWYGRRQQVDRIRQRADTSMSTSTPRAAGMHGSMTNTGQSMSIVN